MFLRLHCRSPLAANVSSGSWADEEIAPLTTRLASAQPPGADPPWRSGQLLQPPGKPLQMQLLPQYHPAALRIVAPGCAGGRREPVGLYRSSDAGGSGGMMRDVAVSTYV
jgi:hypothetical protein